MENNSSNKEKLIGLYMVICIILLCGEPSDDSITIFIVYYSFVLANFANAARLLKKQYGKVKTASN
jgi:hypothetical protein